LIVGMLAFCLWKPSPKAEIFAQSFCRGARCAPAFTMRPGPARKTKSRRPPRWRRTLIGPEDHGTQAAAVVHPNLTIVRRQRQRLSFIRRGWSDPSAAEKINDLQGLAGFGAKPFRLAKLTACRKWRVFIGGTAGCQGGKGRKY
jgi:hypothetical protein